MKRLIYTLLSLVMIVGFLVSGYAQYDQYGGNTNIVETATGFFRLEKRGDTHFLVTPDGHGFRSRGVNHMHSQSGNNYDAIINNIKSWGFNSGDYQGPSWIWNRIPYTKGINVLETVSHFNSTKFKYVDVFSWNYRNWLQGVIQDIVEPQRNNDMLICWFLTDIPVWKRPKEGGWINFFKNLPNGSPGKNKWDTWKSNNPGVNEEQFLGVIAGEVYRLAHEYIRDYDTNHLIFSDKYLSEHDMPHQVVTAALPYIDGIALQPSNNWDASFYNNLFSTYDLPVFIADHVSSFGTSENPNTLGQVVWGASAYEDYYEDYVTNALSTSHIVGVNHCQYRNEDKPTYLKQGLLDDNGNPYSSTTGGITSTNIAILNQVYNELAGNSCGSLIDWNNTSIGTQSGNFSAEWDMIPNGDNMDGAMGFSDGSASAWSDMAVAIRFNTSGNFDARDGGAYSADNNIAYTAGTSYRIRTEVDMGAHTYSVYVRPAGGSEIALGTNFAFRTGTETITQLTHRVVKTVVCDLSVSNFTVSGDTGGEPQLTGTFYLRNKDSGRRIKTSGTGANQNIVLGNTSGTGADYEFEIEEVADEPNRYFIRVNGFPLRNNNCEDTSGTLITTHNSNGTGDCVRWEIIANGDFYNLKNKDNNLYARNTGCADNDGNSVELTGGTGDCAQWTLEPVTVGSASGRISSEIILNTDSGPETLEIQVYPNPAHATLTVLSKAPFQYELIDTAGKSLFSGESEEREAKIDISSLKKGIYLLKYSDGDSSDVRRIIIE